MSARGDSSAGTFEWACMDRLAGRYRTSRVAQPVPPGHYRCTSRPDDRRRVAPECFTERVTYSEFEQFPQPPDERGGNWRIVMEVASGDCGTHGPGLPARGQPRVDMRSGQLSPTELALRVGNTVDVALGARPCGVVLWNHARDKVLEFATALIVGHEPDADADPSGAIENCAVIRKEPRAPGILPARARRRSTASDDQENRFRPPGFRAFGGRGH